MGTGTPESCTEAEFAAALAERSVSFNCGPDPVTITVTSQKTIAADTTIDGGGRITLSGGGTVRIFTVTLGATLDLRNLAIADGRGEYFAGGDGYDVGGGIFNWGTLTLTNCTLSGNSAEYGGGTANLGTLTLTNCTLSGNSAGTSVSCGGGCGGGLAGLGRATMRDTIVANSPSGGDCAASIDYGGPNLIEDANNACGLTNGVNGNIVGVDPQLDPDGLKDNGGPTQTIALLAGSPAIDAGDETVCAAAPVNNLDQRGYERPGTGHTQCSIGAYEADSPGPPPCTAWPRPFK